MRKAPESPQVLEEIAQLEDVLVVVSLADLFYVHTIALSEVSYHNQFKIVLLLEIPQLAVLNDVALGERRAAILDELGVVRFRLLQFFLAFEESLFQVEEDVLLQLLILDNFHLQVLYYEVSCVWSLFEEFVEVELLCESLDFGRHLDGGWFFSLFLLTRHIY